MEFKVTFQLSSSYENPENNNVVYNDEEFKN